ncbi:MAG: hypothetical protein WBC92_12915 [Terracidiphilus sp.]
MKPFMAVAAILSLVCAAAAAEAQTIIPLTLYHDRIPAFHARVNGHDGFFLFDTGGGISVLSPQFAGFSGCTAWGQVTGFRMSGERMDLKRCDNVTFEVAGAQLEDSTTGIFDIMGLVQEKTPLLDGSLALDLFAGQIVTLDVSGRTLTIETPESFAARKRKATEIPARFVRDAEGAALTMAAGVPTPAGMSWMELDSGNDGVFAIGNHIAPLFHLQPDSKAAHPISFLLGGSIPVKGTARTANLIMDGNIGEQFFALWAVTFDLKSGRVWVSPSAR